MFEKEAENYADKNEIRGGSSSFGDETNYHDLRQAFQDGAEFGYNKANEWHKQEDDDIYDVIQKDWSSRYFICIMKDKSRVPAIGSCDEGLSGEVSVNLFFEYDDEKYYIDDIVWWKEIELPKEVEK